MNISKQREDFFKLYPDGMLIEVWEKDKKKRYVKPVLKKEDFKESLLDLENVLL